MRCTRQEQGFTLIEILMVIIIVAILSAIAIPQFIDFQEEARTSRAEMLVGTLRTGIVLQKSNMVLRCGAPVGAWPSAAAIQANDITAGGSYCTAADIPNPAERKFLTQFDGNLPPNPWGNPPSSLVIDCQDFGTCGLLASRKDRIHTRIWETSASTPLFIWWPLVENSVSYFIQTVFASTNVFLSSPCQGGGASFSGGWCYNSTNGGIWADNPFFYLDGSDPGEDGGNNDGGNDDGDGSGGGNGGGKGGVRGRKPPSPPGKNK